MGCSDSKIVEKRDTHENNIKQNEKEQSDTEHKPEEQKDGEQRAEEEKDGEQSVEEQKDGDQRVEEQKDGEQRAEEGNITEQEDNSKNNGIPEQYVTVEKAIEYVKNELKMNDERATQYVQSINKDNDGKINVHEMTTLHLKLKEAREEIEHDFLKMDTEHKGHVSKLEAKEVLGRRFLQLEDADLEKMVISCDKSGDGKIFYEEFVEFYCNVKERASDIEDALKNQSSTLSTYSIPELTHTLKKNGLLNPEIIESLVKDFDLNGDGRIDRQEFIKLWSKIRNISND